MATIERRRHPRVRVLKAARILLKGHFSVIDCTVRNLSEGGACLLVPSMVGIPDRFDIVIGTDKTVLPCRRVWNRDTRLGIEFASAA
jgi:PilZ domain-containing protein